MDQEMKYDEDLIKYLLHESSEEERVVIEEWLSVREENRLHLQELADSLELIKLRKEAEKINVQGEWNIFLQLKENNKAVIPNALTSDIKPDELILIDNTGQAIRGKLFQLLIRVTAAASIILAVLTGFWLWENRGVNNSIVSNTGAIDSNQVSSVEELEIFEANSSSKARSFSLPDGSRITLYPKSELTYREPSNQKQRQVRLIGMADFIVAKDKSRPFSVYSNPISTTAIGTQFTVIAAREQNKIFVRLNEGKVVVKDDSSANKIKMKDMYLIPGQELVYDIAKGTAIVRVFTKDEIIKKDQENVSADDPASGAYSKKSWYRFNNQSLSQIFQTLEGMYKVKIIYSKEELNKMYFIGTFEKNDSLEVVLRQIAFINNLEIQKENNTYKITKKK